MSDSVFAPHVIPLLACHLVSNVSIEHSHLLDDLSDLHLVVELLLTNLKKFETIGLSDAKEPLDGTWTVPSSKELERLAANLLVNISIHMNTGGLLQNLLKLLAPNGRRLLGSYLV